MNAAPSYRRIRVFLLPAESDAEYEKEARGATAT
jgi:hypothetical protein